jgi:hypothetical protein
MTSIFNRLLLGAILYGNVQGLVAQEASPSDGQPTPPYLASVPQKLHWIINFSYVQKNAPDTTPAAPSPDSPLSIDTMRVGNMRRVVVKYVNGTTQQYDIFGTDCYSQYPALGLQCRKMGEGYTPFPYSDVAFPYTGCVTAAAFKDRTTYQGVSVFHYQDGSTEAWISAETRLPVGADQIGFVKTTYQYLPPPDVIVPTPEEQRSIQIQKTAEQTFQQLR